MKLSARGAPCGPWPWCLVAAGVLTGATASASPVFELAGGVGGEGGLNGRTVPGGASSTYYNPALLTEAESGLTLGVLILGEQIGVSLDARPGAQYSVPSGIENATHADGSRWSNYPIATSLLENGRMASALNTSLDARPRQGAGSGRDLFAYQMVGFVTRLFHDRLTLGVYALVPYSKYTGADAFYSDEREQYFTNSLHPELYSDRMVATSLAFGGGVKVTDELSLGLTFTLSLRTEAFTPTYVVDAGRLQDILVDSNVKVNAAVSPHLGASYKPTKRLRLTATVHSPQRLEIDTKFTFLLANGVQQAASVSFTHDYEPWQVGLGGSYDVLTTEKDSVTLAATAVYGRWSDYVDRHSETPTGAYAWYDTITPVGGVRYQHGAVGSFLDGTYQPSPVPAQTGRTNYVDNDRIGVVGGIDYKFELFGTALRVGAQLEGHRLLPRYQAKIPTPTSPDGRNHTPGLVADEVPDDAILNGQPVAGRQGLQTNNPGWPGFASEGWVLGGGVYLSVLP
jgi:long-chain fatty acid transport protein